MVSKVKFIASSHLGRMGACAAAIRLKKSHSSSWRKVASLALMLPLAACAGKTPRQEIAVKSSLYDAKTGVSASPRVYTARRGRQQRRSVPKGGGGYKLGKPYKVSGRWYVPKHQPGYDRTGIASWYGDDFHGRKTANGEIYDMNALTAAHPTLPLPSYVYVTNLGNGRTILVRVNDRGPYARGRIIDMSRAAATALGYHGKGLARVRVRYAGPAPLHGSDRRERRFLARQPWYRGGRRLARADYRRRVHRKSSIVRRRAARHNASPAPLHLPKGRVPTWYWRPGQQARQQAGQRSGYRRSAFSHQRRRSAYASSRSALGRRVLPAPARARQMSRGRLFVQAGVFLNLDNAERLRVRLARLGAVHVAPVSVGQSTGYRVYIGPVRAGHEQRLLAQVSANGVSAPRLLRQ